MLDQGLWKLKYSKVTNMGPRAEAVYWGEMGRRIERVWFGDELLWGG